MTANLLTPERFNDIFKDLLASVVVFLVALPLCIGIAMASGMPPASGIITGIIGGLVVSALGGCRLQISGPAAGLAVIIYELLHGHGLEVVGPIVLIAGLIQVAAGLCGFAQYFRAVPPAVIHGMLSGIGILIFAGQFHVMVDDLPRSSGMLNIMSIPESILKGITPNPVHTHNQAAMLGILTITLLVLWQKFAPRKLRVLPGALIAITTATAVAYFCQIQVKYVDLPDNLLQAVNWISAAGLLQFARDHTLFLDALALAFIASAETLLTCTALDKMHTGSRTKYDRELSAQGIGNVLCGLVGAVPMTGVMVRSGVNLSAGARTRCSGFLHGVWLLFFVCCMPHLIRIIPTSALAALLVFTGYKLANVKVYKELLKFGRSEVAIYAITVVSIVAIDLLTGIVVGIVLTAAKLLYIFSHLQVRFADDPATNCTNIWLKGSATFLCLPKLATVLEEVRPGSEVEIHLDAVDYVDHACLDLLMSWDKQHQSTGGILILDWAALSAVSRNKRGKIRQSRATLEFRPAAAADGQEQPPA